MWPPPYYIIITAVQVNTRTPDELRFLLGREYGHVRYGHVPIMTIIDTLGGDLGRVPFVGGIVNFIFSGWTRAATHTADRAGLLVVQRSQPRLQHAGQAGDRPCSLRPRRPRRAGRTGAQPERPPSTKRRSYGLPAPLTARRWGVSRTCSSSPSLRSTAGCARSRCRSLPTRCIGKSKRVHYFLATIYTAAMHRMYA